MGVRESWNELGTGGKVLVGLLAVGVALVGIVVVTVLLSAVIASFVLGVGDASGTSPQVSMTFEYDASSETARLTHDGGDSVEAANLLIETDEQTFEWTTEDGDVVAGESTVVDASPGTTIRVVWSDGEETSVLASHTVQ